jgi:hypothetical protein
MSFSQMSFSQMSFSQMSFSQMSQKQIRCQLVKCLLPRSRGAKCHENSQLNKIITGGSDDWAKGGAGIKYSYTIELPDRGQVENGFFVAADGRP